MLLGLLYVFLSILCIIEGCASIVINLNEVSSLLVHLRVDLLSDVIDVSHELLHVVQLVLTLFDQIVHVGSLSLHLQFLNIQLLLLQKLLVLLVMQRRTRLVIHQSLAALDEIQVLLHLDVDLLRLLAVFVNALGQTAVVSLLLLLLLALRAIGHADLTVVVNLLLQTLGLVIHFLLLVADARAQFVRVFVCSDLVLLKVGK